MSRRSLPGQVGFTLLELMIAVVVVGILAAIAYPTYVDLVIKSRRADGKALLMSAAARQEQFFLDNKQYAANMTVLGFLNDPEPSQEKYYTVAVSSVDVTAGFTLTATPVAPQTADTECGDLTINQQGSKGISTSVDPAVVITCW